MRITQEADYAIRFVHILAKEEGRVLGAPQLSQAAATPERYTLKILHKLKHQGLVVSTKGIRGGYQLAQGPEEITLKAVIEAIDGPIALSKCMGDEPCTRMGNEKHDCCFHRVFCTVSHELEERLAGISIADMLKEEQGCGQN